MSADANFSKVNKQSTVADLTKLLMKSPKGNYCNLLQLHCFLPPRKFKILSDGAFAN